MHTKQQNIDLVDQIQQAMMKVTGIKRRGQHLKMHACLNAQFTVSADIPVELKVGMFSEAKTYDAFVRFSNGDKEDDRMPDIHGMAIKLLGVEGDKVLEGQEHETTHDFILADNPLFFIRTAAEYVPFIEDFARSSAAGVPPAKFINWLKENRPKDLPVFLGFSQQKMESPLTSEYWSQVPYALGVGDDRICRYSVVPAKSNPVNPTDESDRSEHYLREILVDALTTNEAYFEFYVQPCLNATYDVINNPTVEWDLPRYKIATLTISAQNFDTNERRKFGENLSYTPWHALPEHRPLGEVNEIRKQVYLSSSKIRHNANHATSVEPTTI